MRLTYLGSARSYEVASPYIDAMAEEDNVIKFDLEPAPGQVGQLHEYETAYHYLANSSYNPLFHFEVVPACEIHGCYSSERLPASLLVFDVRFIPKRQARPIQWASVTATFEGSSGKKDSKNAPKVLGFAPGRPPLRLECSIESQKATTSQEVGAGGSSMGAQLDAKLAREKEASIEKLYFAMVSNFSESSDGRNFPNSVCWVLEGNKSQQSSIPPEISLAVLLQRDRGTFLCSIEIEIEVTWPQQAKAWFTAFKKWFKRTPRYKVYNPDTVRDIPDAFKSVNADSLEHLAADKGKLLNELVDIRMPKVYPGIE